MADDDTHTALAHAHTHIPVQWYILAVLVLLLDLNPPPLGRTKIFPTPPPRGGVVPERFLAHGDAV